MFGPARSVARLGGPKPWTAQVSSEIFEIHIVGREGNNEDNNAGLEEGNYEKESFAFPECGDEHRVRGGGLQSGRQNVNRVDPFLAMS